MKISKAYQFEITENSGELEVLHEVSETDGIVYIRVHISNEETKVFSTVKCKITVPACGVYDIWTPKIHLIKALNSDWFDYLEKTNGFTGAPVQCLVGIDNYNCACIGLSDTLNTIGFSCTSVEETGEYAFLVELFTGDNIERHSYDITIRLDNREIPYYRALQDMSKWWEENKDNTPTFVPETAKELMYSTWYSYHQDITEQELLKQCRLAKKLGCESILIDDGWQTEDKNRGYAYCGDWIPSSSKISDMKKFVDEVHQLGMKILPWYSLPFIGEKSENFHKFKDMLIDPKANRMWHVLDPRYPEVREFIFSLFEKALLEWNVDGFKMDFIDEFVVTPFSGNLNDNRRDFASVHEALDSMMKECVARLRTLKPDIMLEFRQTYNGPRMRSYGNIFRAVDCPFDALENHIRVTDIRMLCGESAVHSDMIMWNKEELTENAALQIINVLFSVPQISMRLEELSDDQLDMLKFYCKLWKKYQNPFVKGSFEPQNPGENYSIIKGVFKEQMVCTYHSKAVIDLKFLYNEMIFVNGSLEGKLYLENKNSETVYKICVYTCTGKLILQTEETLNVGINQYLVPKSGVIIFQK